MFESPVDVAFIYSCTITSTVALPFQYRTELFLIDNKGVAYLTVIHIINVSIHVYTRFISILEMYIRKISHVVCKKMVK